MQTALADFIRETPQGREADRILRACVHCGFCTATCPTYQLLGDELDGPRGRIYQIKQLLEGEPPTAVMREHLDRCLVCRSCETTCPSGVDYHRLLDIGREVLEEQLPRPPAQRAQRDLMRWLFGDARRFAPVLGLARGLRPLLPASLRRKILPRPAPLPTAPVTAGRRMLRLEGCVQPALSPDIDQAMQRLLGHLDIAVETAPQAGCCGALPQHLDAPEQARALARRNIDAWLPLLEDGVEALLATASGCGAHLHDYPALLAADPVYAERARQLVERLRDPVQVLAQEDLSRLPLRPRPQRIAVHTPCTLQHGLHLNGQVETLLESLGYRLVPVAEGHLCCGSAGTYALTQPTLSQRLRERKRAALTVEHPELIVTANIGCLSHLHDEEGPPVLHWLVLLARDLEAA